MLQLQITQSSSQTPSSSGITFNKCIIGDSAGNKIKEYTINLIVTEKGQVVGTILDMNFTTNENKLTCQVYCTDKTTVATGALATFNSSLSPKAGWYLNALIQMVK